MAANVTEKQHRFEPFLQPLWLLTIVKWDIAFILASVLPPGGIGRARETNEEQLSS